jgi:hypothetical protein
MGVTDLRHPPRASKVGFVHGPGAIRLGGHVDLEYGGGRVLPIGSVSLGVEQQQIRSQMAFVVAGELRASGRAVVESTCAHDAPEYSTALTNRIVADQFRSADWT